MPIKWQCERVAITVLTETLKTTNMVFAIATVALAFALIWECL